MGTMPRPRPPRLQRAKTRHGNFVWYVRMNDPARSRIRLRAPYGTPEFDAEYKAAVDGRETGQQAKARAPTGSLAWLWGRYREAPVWMALKPGTRRGRENIMVHVLAKVGNEPAGEFTRAEIVAARDARASTPAQSRNFLDTMRGLFRWAADPDVGHIPSDPTIGVKNLKKVKTNGFPMWTEEDVEAYQKKWPLGTKERVWLDMLLYTGPRRGDAVKIGRQHVRKVFDKDMNAWIRYIAFKTEKGDEMVEVTIPILAVLQETIDAGPCGQLSFICGERGNPLTKESFGNMFSAAARAAGIKKSAHGVRKIAATTAADNGATVHQLMAIFGWKTTQMAEHYTREANRRRLARAAMHTLGRTSDEQSMGAPGQKVRPIAGISE